MYSFLRTWSHLPNEKLNFLFSELLILNLFKPKLGKYQKYWVFVFEIFKKTWKSLSSFPYSEQR